MRRLPWFLAVLLGVTAWGSSPGAAAVAGDRVQTVDVVAVPTAPHARIDYLTGRLLHTADRRVIQLPWPRRYQDSLELLGRGPDGWIVA